VKNSDGTTQTPMSRVKTLAKNQVKRFSKAKKLVNSVREVNENNSAPQTAAHRRAMMVGVNRDIMKKRAQDNEKARQALKDPDHNPAWANSTTPRSKFAGEATDTQKQISDLENMLSRMSGNTSSVKMKKYALQRKIDKLKGQVKEARDPSKLEATLVRGKEVHDKTFANRTQADNFAKKNGGRVRQVGRVFYVFKESVNEGRPSQQHPLEDHPYHRKTNAQLIYIGKDAHAAAEAMKGHNTEKENKYRDQANDAATVRHFRKKSGMPDWYKKKYGHGVKESVEEGTADRYKMIKKIGDKLNKEKKKAERDAMRHAKRDNEYQTESSASDEGERAASQGQSYSSNPYPKGSPNHLEWSKGHNKARARRLNMGESKEEFTLKHFHKNEDENRHTENGVKLVNKFGTSAENIKMGGIAARHNMRGSISRKDQQDRDALVKKYYPKLKDTTSVKKTNEATQFKVDIDGLPPTFIQGKSVGEIMANLRKIVKQPSLIKDVERVTDYTVKKTYRAKAQGKEVDEAANPDEGSMALTQLEFIEYAAEELSDHIKKGGDFPEWMQNKLTKAHTTMEGLHSSMGDHGGDDDENEKDD